MKNFKLNETDILSNQDWTFPTHTIYGPGRFKEIGNLCQNNNIKNPLIVSDSGSRNLPFIQNLEILLNFYKKTKNINLINMILFLTDYYFYNLKKKENDNIEKIIEDKSFVISNINKFIEYNLNQNSLINAITNKLSNG